MPVSLKAAKPPLRTSSQQLWHCANRLSLTCTSHGEEISVPCGRWRDCPGCGRRLQWRLRTRFLEGIKEVPQGKLPMFFTLTFEADNAPDEQAAHRALRALVRRLRYRDYLGAYGWVLHRQKNGTLHYHGIAHMPWFDDSLAEWRELIRASGFGIQNRLVQAEPEHAGYCTRYISTRLAELAPLRRAYAFSREFPTPSWQAERSTVNRILAEISGRCSWEPSSMVWHQARR